MSARRIIPVSINVSQGKAFDSSFVKPLDESDLRLILSEEVLFRFTCKFTSDGGVTYDTFGFASGTSFRIGIKDPGVITGATFLAYADGAAWNQTTDWSEADPAAGKLCVRLSLNTSAANTFLSSSGTTTQRCVIEIEVTEPGETPFTVAQWFIGLNNDVIRGTEGDPTPGSPTYPTSADLLAVLGSGIVFQRQGDKVVLKIDGVPTASWDKPT